MLLEAMIGDRLRVKGIKGQCIAMSEIDQETGHFDVMTPRAELRSVHVDDVLY